MTNAALLDTSFLITLVNKNRPNHQTAGKYYKHLVEQQIPMYFSAIAAAEFEIKQSITELPLTRFRKIPFTFPNAIGAAKLWNALGGHDKGDDRAVVRDDVKLIAQAIEEKIPFLLTEDQSTLYKYCERLRSMGQSQVRAIKLVDGFRPDYLRLDGQADLLQSSEDQDSE